MPHTPLSPIPCHKFSQGSWRTIEDIVPPEEKVVIYWGDTQHSLWAYPHNLHDLVMGYAALDLCAAHDEPHYLRHLKTTFYLQPVPKSVRSLTTSLPSLTGGIVLETMTSFLQRPGLWEQTGCFHRMAVYNPHSSEFECFVEDIGRHNCVDRLAGWSLRTARTLHDLVLLCSSRVTGSLMSKIARTGIPVVISRSATTRSAIEEAQAHGITLIGFTRGNRCTLFCDPHAKIRMHP